MFIAFARREPPHCKRAGTTHAMQVSLTGSAGALPAMKMCPPPHPSHPQALCRHSRQSQSRWIRLPAPLQAWHGLSFCQRHSGRRQRALPDSETWTMLSLQRPHLSTSPRWAAQPSVCARHCLAGSAGEHVQLHMFNHAVRHEWQVCCIIT